MTSTATELVVNREVIHLISHEPPEALTLFCEVASTPGTEWCDGPYYALAVEVAVIYALLHCDKAMFLLFSGCQITVGWLVMIGMVQRQRRLQQMRLLYVCP